MRGGEMSELIGCLVTVEGHYFALAGSVDRKKVKKPYKITVRVPAPEGALSVIKNKILDRALTKVHKDYHTYHTHEITGITDLNGNPLMGYSNVRIMNFNQIAQYVRVNNLPLKLELYTDLDTLRTMVFLAETNEKLFAIKQIVLEREAQEDSLLAALNPDLFDKAHPIHVPIVTEVPNIEPAKKVQDQRVQQTWDEKKKAYVPVSEFEEDFDRPEEAPYETYSNGAVKGDDEVGDEGATINQNPPSNVTTTSQPTVDDGLGKALEQVEANQAEARTTNLIDEL